MRCCHTQILKIFQLITNSVTINPKIAHVCDVIVYVAGPEPFDKVLKYLNYFCISVCVMYEIITVVHNRVFKSEKQFSV